MGVKIYTQSGMEISVSEKCARGKSGTIQFNGQRLVTTRAILLLGGDIFKGPVKKPALTSILLSLQQASV